MRVCTARRFSDVGGAAIPRFSWETYCNAAESSDGQSGPRLGMPRWKIAE